MWQKYQLDVTIAADPLMKPRCDGRVDCKDKSDEEDCGRAVIGSSYNKAMTPPPLAGKYNECKKYKTGIARTVQHFRDSVLLLRQYQGQC